MLPAQLWLKTVCFPWFIVSEVPKQSHTLLVFLPFACPHLTVAWNTDKRLNFSHFCLSFWRIHKDLLHCPQKCLSLLCRVSVVPRIKQSCHWRSGISLITANSRDLFSMPAFTHQLEATMRYPQKQKLACIHEGLCILLKELHETT